MLQPGFLDQRVIAVFDLQCSIPVFESNTRVSMKRAKGAVEAAILILY